MRPGLKKQFNIGFVPDGLAQAGDESGVLAGQAAGSARIGKDDRFRAIFRKYRKSPAHGIPGLHIYFNPEVAQYSHGGRMQPFTRQSLGGLGVRFQQGHPGALSRMGKRTQTANRPRSNDGNVVASGHEAVLRKTPVGERWR